MMRFKLKILRRVDAGDSGFFERDGILRRDDAADDDRDVRRCRLLSDAR